MNFGPFFRFLIVFLSSRIIALEDAHDFVLLLLLIGMDLTASPILKRDVAEAIDLVCHCLSPRDSSSIDTASLSFSHLLMSPHCMFLFRSSFCAAKS